MSPSPSTSRAEVMAALTSESPSPSMSSPSTRSVSAISVTDGEDAMASKPGAVRKVSSFTMSKPQAPGLGVVPAIPISM